MLEVFFGVCGSGLVGLGVLVLRFGGAFFGFDVSGLELGEFFSLGLSLFRWFFFFLFVVYF